MKTKTRFLLTLLLAIAMGTKVMAAEKEAYAVYTSNDSTLTFYYDDRKSEKEGIKYSLNTGRNEPEWIEDGKKLARAVFTLSFADYRPTSTFKWFYEQPDLKTIDHISDYLKTDEVRTMEGMFYGCESLNNLDVSGWDTSKRDEHEQYVRSLQ